MHSQLDAFSNVLHLVHVILALIEALPAAVAASRVHGPSYIHVHCRMYAF